MYEVKIRYAGRVVATQTFNRLTEARYWGREMQAQYRMSSVEINVVKKEPRRDDDDRRS